MGDEPDKHLQPEQSSAPAPEAAPETGLTARVDSLESKVDRILGLVSGDRQGEAEAPAQAGSPNIAHEIRAQLDERDAKARAEADEAAKADRLGTIETKLAELAEKPPEPMPRRIEKFMGWR